MTAETLPPAAAAGADAEMLQEQPAPACVMSFNASDPSGAGGIAGDVATIAAMGAHALPVVTSIVMRDTAEVFTTTSASIAWWWSKPAACSKT
jgi:hydroxymethylpyrimidine/phosphomethylpyrimidine kinase